MKKFHTFFTAGIFALIFLPVITFAQTKSTFEDLLSDPSAYWNGVTRTYGTFSTTVEDSVFRFSNTFSRNDYGFGLYESWNGMAYSRMQDDTTSGYTNQYSAITTGGAFSTENYAVFYISTDTDTIPLSRTTLLDSVYITNGTYPYLSMRDGDMFAKKFGGESGNDPDWFLLTIQGIKDELVTGAVEFYLADFRDSNNDNDYIIDEWTKVDLSVLDSVDMLRIGLSSSDTGDFGMNTPAYFCMDNLSGADFDELTYISGDYWNGKTACFGQYTSVIGNGPANFDNIFSINDYGYGEIETWTGFAFSSMKDDTTAGYTNQYSAYPASGVNGSNAYALCYNSRGTDTIKFTAPVEISGTFVANGTYTVLSMLHGDAFAKMFGGESGNDPDWFMLTIQGLNEGLPTNTVEFYLADYRFENNEEDYIVTDWEFVDLTALGEVDMIEFSLSSSDTGAYGMNTPAYFFIDDLNDHGPEIVTPVTDLIVDENAPDEVVDLSATFTDVDDEDSAIALSVVGNTNESLVGTSIDGTGLTLSFTENTSGDALITVEAFSNGQRVNDIFRVTVNNIETTESLTLNALSIYPNPTNGRFHLQMPVAVECHVDIYNAMGQRISSHSITDKDTELNIEDQPSGIYYIVVSNTSDTVHRQLIKRN